MSEEPDRNGKLELRYGKTTTPYLHFTVIAEGRIEGANDVNGGPDGPAFMAMKAWGSSSDEAAGMIDAIGPELGFRVTGRIHVYETEPREPPRDKPFGYDIDFTPYEAQR